MANNNGKVGIWGISYPGFYTSASIIDSHPALVAAVAQFGPGIQIEAIAVANLNDAASPPCGACRQMLSEFVLPDAPVIFPAADGQRTMAFSALLPLAFEMKIK